MKSKLILIALALLLFLTFAESASAAETIGYKEIKLRNKILTTQVNQERNGLQLLAPKYGLGKIAYKRAMERALERDATGTSEFDHNLDPITAYLERNGFCYNWVGEVIGFSNTLSTASREALADDIVDRWMASDNHRPYIISRSADWGGGSWVRSDSGTYFFVFYVVDICGI